MRKFVKSTFAAVALAAVAPALAADSAPAPAAPVKPAYSTAETTIGTLLDTPETRAVIDKLLPGMSSDPQVEQGRGITLRFAQQFKPDMLTDELLAKVDEELAKIPAKN